MAWTTLCDLADLKEGEGTSVDVDGYRLAVFVDQGEPAVLTNTCPHAGAPMSEGWVQNGCAICPRHCWAFDLKDGTIQGTGAPGLTVFKSRILEHAGRRLLQADLPMP